MTDPIDPPNHAANPDADPPKGSDPDAAAPPRPGTPSGIAPSPDAGQAVVSKIVDVHAHLWQSPEQLGADAAHSIRQMPADPWDRANASPEAFDEAMATVQHAIIHGFESQFLDASIPHEQVAGYVARNPQRYLGFAGIDPMDRGYMASLDRAVELGLVGVTISPAAQNYHPCHTRAMRLYARCEELGLPIMVHLGTHFGSAAVLGYSQPHLFDEPARTFPKLRMVIAQLGHPWIEEALVLIGKHRNLFADLSDLTRRPWQLYNSLLLAHQQGVIGQLLFGSDFPFMTPQDAIVTIYSVNTFFLGTNLPAIPREQLRAVVEHDALTSLGITAPAGQPTSGSTAPGSVEPAKT